MMRWSVICKEHKLLLQGTLVTWKTVKNMKASMTDQLSEIQQTKEPQMSVLVMISQGRRLRGCKNGYHFVRLGFSHGILGRHDRIQSIHIGSNFWSGSAALGFGFLCFPLVFTSRNCRVRRVRTWWKKSGLTALRCRKPCEKGGKSGIHWIHYPFQYVSPFLTQKLNC